MQQKYHTQIENFVNKSNTEMFWGNGAFYPIASPKNDKDALIKGHIKGASILLGEDVVIHQQKYRAILFEKSDNIQEIAIYENRKDDDFFKTHPVDILIKNKDNNLFFRTYPVNILPDSVVQKFSFITKNNYDIIKKYAKETGTDVGSNFGVYISGIENCMVSYTDKPGEENIQISKIITKDAYPYQLKIDQNGNVVWDYLCISLPWSKDKKERELNEIIQMITARFENQIYNESKYP